MDKFLYYYRSIIFVGFVIINFNKISNRLKFLGNIEKILRILVKFFFFLFNVISSYLIPNLK